MGLVALITLFSLPALVLMGQLTLFRMAPGPSGLRQKQTAFLILLAMMGTVAAAFLLEWRRIGMAPDWGLLDWVFAFGVVAVLGHLYFDFFNMSETARRIRFVTMIALKGNRVGREAVLEDYTPRAAFEVRLARLRALGSVEVVGDKIRARAGILLAASLLIKGHELLLFPSRRTR